MSKTESSWEVSGLHLEFKLVLSDDLDGWDGVDGREAQEGRGICTHIVDKSKNWCIQIAFLEKGIKSPLDSKEIKPVNPKGNQLWIFIRRTDAEAELSIL